MTDMGQTTKGFLILGAILVFLVGARTILGLIRPQSDKALIETALKESIQASKDGHPNGVLDKLSNNIQYNGTSAGGHQQEIADFIRDKKPDVVVENLDPVVTGDEATIVSPIDLKLSLLGQSMEKHVKDVTLLFKKEEDREWLIIPTHKWKLVEVHVPDASVAELIQQ